MIKVTKIKEEKYLIVITTDEIAGRFLLTKEELKEIVKQGEKFVGYKGNGAVGSIVINLLK